MSYKEKNEEEEERAKERHVQVKDMLCLTVARNLKKSIMKNVKEAELDIAKACTIFHRRHEQKTGKPIVTISEFEQVTRAFSKLPKYEMDKLIREGKEEKRVMNH